jgi:flagellar protein FlbD
MIKVTRLDHSELVVNAELIETVEATPDTVITLTSGKKLVVSEHVDEIIRRVMEYRRHACGAQQK